MTNPTRLIPLDKFAPVIEPLLGKRVGYVQPRGNVGDLLIERGMEQLFDEYGVRWRRVKLGENAEDIEQLVFGGGGNMGTRYQDNWDIRARALELGIPMTILPQTFSSEERRPYHRVYVRERASLEFCPNAILAPDLALGLQTTRGARPTRELGVFLRRDRERTRRIRWFSRDPVQICQTPEEYLTLAASYERIVTDRLHFAICGLLCGRDTTLLANDYHKNRSMHETWLAEIGCRFAPSYDQISSRRAA